MIPESTPFSVYCQARAIVAAGLNVGPVVHDVRHDPRLLFAAMIGIEDGLLAKRDIDRFADKRPLPTEGEIMMAVASVVGSPLGLATEHEMRTSEVLGVVPGSLALTWDETDEIAERRIADVIIGGRFRPTRATWQKLIDAGLPMCSWEEASESWDMSEQRREVCRDLLRDEK